MQDLIDAVDEIEYILDNDPSVQDDRYERLCDSLADIRFILRDTPLPKR